METLWKAPPITPIKTEEAFCEYMRPLFFYDGLAVADLIVEENGVYVKDLIGRKLPADMSLFTIIWSRDTRYIYDMNRSIVGVHEDYKGEPEKWEMK